MTYPPEPWECVRYENVDYTHPDNVTIDHAANGSVLNDVEPNTAHRIVACVNACKELPTEALEGVSLAGILRNSEWSLDDECGSVSCIYCHGHHQKHEPECVIAKLLGSPIRQPRKRKLAASSIKLDTLIGSGAVEMFNKAMEELVVKLTKEFREKYYQDHKTLTPPGENKT